MESPDRELSQEILDIELKHLKGLVPHFPMKEILSLGVKTISDFLEYDFTPHYDRGSYVFLYKYRIDLFIKKLYSNPQSLYEYAQKVQKNIAEKQPKKKLEDNNSSVIKKKANQPYWPDQKILDIKLQNLLGTIMGFSTKELKKLRIKTVNDLLSYNLASYYMDDRLNSYQDKLIRNDYNFRYNSRRTKLNEGILFQKKLRVSLLSKIKYSGEYFLNQSAKETPSDLDPEIAVMQLEELRDMLTPSLIKKLNDIGLKTVNELMEVELEQIFLSDRIGKFSVKEIIEFKEKVKTQPETILQFPHRYDLTPEEILKNDSCLAGAIPEIFQDRNGENITRREFFIIRLYSLRRILPEFLFTRLLYNDVKTIKDLLECRISQLPPEIQNNQKFCWEFMRVRNEIITDPVKYFRQPTALDKNLIAMRDFLAKPDKYDHYGDILDLYGVYYPLPIKPGIPETETPLGVLKTIINDYHETVKRTSDEPNFIAIYYGIDNPKRNLEEIGYVLDLTGERCRQLFPGKLLPISGLLRGKKIRSMDIFIRREAMNLLAEPIRYVSERPIHFYTELKNYFASNIYETFNEEKENLLELFLNALGYNVYPYAKTDIIKEKLVIINKITRSGFRIIARKLNTFIISTSEKVGETEIMHKFCKKGEGAGCNFIIALLRILPEIEKLEDLGKVYYQKKPTAKIKNRDIIFRILSEKGEKMLRTELFAEAWKRAGNDSGLAKTYFYRQLFKDKRIKAITKTGYWALAEWDINTDSQRILIRKVLKKLNRPASQKEILHEVHKIRPDILSRSLYTVVNTYFLPLLDGNYILPEWKNKYDPLIRNYKKGHNQFSENPLSNTIRNNIIELIKTSETGKLRASEICRKIIAQNPTFDRATIYKILNSKTYFKKSSEPLNKQFIELK